MIAGFGDRARIREFCRRDPARYAFHLGDLSDREWPHTTWFAWEEAVRLAELALLYEGLSLPSLQLLGSKGPMGERLDELLPHLPREFYVHAFSEDMEKLAAVGDLEDHGPFLRLRWDGFPKWPLSAADGDLSRLGPSDAPDLADFFEKIGPGVYYEQSQLAKSPFYGIRKEGRLLACAGFHVWSPEEGLGVLGNIATLPEARGKGYARAVTARLLARQASLLPIMVLNVSLENAAAGSLYDGLGFREALRFHEGRVRLPRV